VNRYVMFYLAMLIVFVPIDFVVFVSGPSTATWRSTLLYGAQP
jgi:hypothetical protein